MSPAPSHRKRLRSTFVALLAFALAPAAVAEPPPGKGSRGANGADSSLAVTVSAGISAGDARQVDGRYGLIGVKPMPPGIA